MDSMMLRSFCLDGLSILLDEFEDSKPQQRDDGNTHRNEWIPHGAEQDDQCRDDGEGTFDFRIHLVSPVYFISDSSQDR
jgi:hypothetical protein